MKVAIVGGTGFVGSYIVEALLAEGATPRLLVRQGSESKVEHPTRVEEVPGELADAKSVVDLLEGVDAVVYNVGILRESPSRGITFEELQASAPMRLMNVASQLGVKRFVLMSANGVDARSTPYQQTKWRAEQALIESDFDWTILRPSVVFGDPRGRSEFASQLLNDVVRSPLPMPLFYPGLSLSEAGKFELTPVHVENVASVFAKCLVGHKLTGQIVPLGGPLRIDWRTILQRIAEAVGEKKMSVPVPAVGVYSAAALFDWMEKFPVTRDQLQMLLEGNCCTSDALQEMGIDPKPFDLQHLAYLNRGEDTWRQKVA